MLMDIDKSDNYTQLRKKAEFQLQSGTAPRAGHWTVGVDTLRLLHELSSNPDKADDAIKLLHELQVHQVELDLQNEEIATNEQSIEGDLHLYQTLYDHAPLAYCVVDLEGIVIQGNLATAKLFGVGQDDLVGRRIDSLLNPQSRPLLLDLLQRVAQSGARGFCNAELSGVVHDSRQMHFQASISPETGQFLLACCECDSAK